MNNATIQLKISPQLKWYNANKELAAQRKKEHYNNNRELYLERAKKFGKSDTRKKYLLDNKERTKAYNKEVWKTKKLLKPHLKTLYNLSLEEHQELLVKQLYCCKGCGKPESELKRSLCVDHCHKTGNVRGLLCHSCNLAIGFVNDDITILSKLINYLKDEQFNNTD
jgi:hypothetical protein